MSELRWTTIDSPGTRPALFDAVVERKVGRGAYRGLEFLLVESRSVINRVPNPGVSALHAHHQRLPWMQPRLHVLLRPAQP